MCLSDYWDQLGIQGLAAEAPTVLDSELQYIWHANGTLGFGVLNSPNNYRWLN